MQHRPEDATDSQYELAVLRVSHEASGACYFKITSL
jgi:hypothetical protein